MKLVMYDISIYLHNSIDYSLYIEINTENKIHVYVYGEKSIPMNGVWLSSFNNHG